MKKALLVAASLFTAASAVTTGEAVKASPQFVLTQNSAGNLLFQGVGTAQYNNSIGTNNSFQVGSSTNLGVNASTSSTPEYKVDSHAKLDLAGTSTLKQIIGTSGASQSTSAETIAALDYADTQATEKASAAGIVASGDFKASHGSSYSDWSSNYYGMSGYSGGYNFTSQSDWEDALKGEISAAETSEYNSVYSDTYSKAESAINTSTSTNTSNGIIKGTFTTTESGEAGSSGTISDWVAASTQDADDEIQATFRQDYAAFLLSDKDALGAALNTYSDEGAYKSARDAAWSTAYKDSYSSTALSSQRKSESDVTVAGIGSDASVTSAATSTFDVNITTALSQPGDAESTATANGAAGANLSTSSFANQSMASTASAFMQAFGGEADATAAALKEANRVGYTSNADIGAALTALSGTNPSDAIAALTAAGFDPADYGFSAP